jgi:mono/diheme cytochrome c family protein
VLAQYGARLPCEVVLPTALRRAGAATALLLLALPAGAADDSAKVYVAKCQACHGVEGKSPFPELSLLDDKWIHGGTLAAITKVIENGVPGKAMVGFKEQLTKAEIDALARYVRSLSKKAKNEKGAK